MHSSSRPPPSQTWALATLAARHELSPWLVVLLAVLILPAALLPLVVLTAIASFTAIWDYTLAILAQRK